MKTLTSIFAAAFVAALLAPPAKAASQDECAIWICLPGGFPSGCGDAHSAFKKRLKKGKSPLPSWGSCTVSDAGTPPVDASASYGKEPYFPCRDGYRLVRGKREREMGVLPALCVSLETRRGEPVDTYLAQKRPNGGRFVTYRINGEVIHPFDSAGNRIADPRFFY